MKNKILTTIAFAAFTVGIYFMLLFVGMFSVHVEFKTSYDVDVNNGNKKYFIQARHWRKFNIIGSQYYFDIPENKVDSIKNSELAISKKLQNYIENQIPNQPNKQ